MNVADFTAFLYWQCLVLPFYFTVNLPFRFFKQGFKFIAACSTAELLKG